MEGNDDPAEEALELPLTTLMPLFLCQSTFRIGCGVYNVFTFTAEVYDL